MRTEGGDAVRGRLQDLDGACGGDAAALLSERDADALIRQGKRDEDRAPLVARDAVPGDVNACDVDVDEPVVAPRESEIIDAGFRPVDELLADLAGFETWSQICLRALFER